MVGTLAAQIARRTVLAFRNSPVAVVGNVEAAVGDGRLLVQSMGRRTLATLATEEPIRAGERVYLTLTDVRGGGARMIVHGSKRA